MPHPKVSVIIPVYKAEDYIEKCAESLFGQTLDELEYIFVDDCSPDDSIGRMYQVLSRFPKRGSQVRVLRHESNKGVSQARQDGVDAAQGEYLIHCDPDDWVEDDLYANMYELAKSQDADIVICDFSAEMDNVARVIKQEASGDAVECVRKMLTGELHCGTCNKLVRESLYRNFRFPSGINLWEDVCVMIPIVLASKKIVSLSSGGYHYRQINPHSYTLNISDKGVEDIVNSISLVEKYIHSEGISLTDAFIQRKVTAKTYMLNYTSGKTQEKVGRLFPELRGDISKLNISFHSKVGLWLNELIGIRGYRFYQRLIKCIRKLDRQW